MSEVEKKTARQKVLDEKAKVSGKISDLCRYIGFGLVAVVYTILTSDSKLVSSIYMHYTDWLFGVAILGVLTVIFDYLQYFGGYCSAEKALKNEAGGYLYDDNSIWYCLRNSSFHIKQITAFSGAIILVVLIGMSAFNAQ